MNIDMRQFPVVLAKDEKRLHGLYGIITLNENQRKIGLHERNKTILFFKISHTDAQTLSYMKNVECLFIIKQVKRSKRFDVCF